MALETTETPTPEEGASYLPVEPPVKGQRRFIPSLHVPSPSNWFGTLAAITYLSTRNQSDPVIAQEVIDDLLATETKAKRGKVRR